MVFIGLGTRDHCVDRTATSPATPQTFISLLVLADKLAITLDSLEASISSRLRANEPQPRKHKQKKQRLEMVALVNVSRPFIWFFSCFYL